MSTELLINFDKNSQKTTTSSNANLNKNDLKEKKEGMSLFDSLMNEAKSNETQTEEKSNKEDKVIEKDIKSSLNKEDKIVEKDTKIFSNKKENLTLEEDASVKTITTNTISEVTEKKDISLKKLVEKLVDIVVSAAKDIFDKKDSKNMDVTEVKNTVEKLLNKKIETVEDKETLKKIVSKKLDIINNSVEIIKTEVKENKLVTPSNILDEKIKELTDNSKEIIKTEVKVIKNNVKDIHKDIIVLENNQSESKNKKNNEIKNNVEKNLIIIDESSDEIENMISKINGVDKKENLTKEESEVSIDKYKKIDFEEKPLLKVSNAKVVEDNATQITKTIENKIGTIKESIATINNNILEITIVKTTEEKLAKKETIQVENKIMTSESNTKDSEKPLIASMFLNAQKSTKNQTSLEQIKDAKSNINDKKTIESVKVSAEKLDLKLEDTEVTHEEEVGQKPVSTEKKEELKTNSLINNKLLNRVIIDQKIEANNQNREQNAVSVQKEQIAIVDNEKKINESIEIHVPKEIIPTLQNKIIGAQQKMGSFMSEVARNMYLNYKPPVTAFRVNLNPANLGSISIMMKANKVDNSLTVSMNLSNSNTMEAFTENKIALQNAIQRQFNETSNVSINFNLDNKNSENEFGQSSENNQKNQNNNSNNSDNEVEDIEENEIIATNDYM